MPIAQGQVFYMHTHNTNKKQKGKKRKKKKEEEEKNCQLLTAVEGVAGRRLAFLRKASTCVLRSL